MRNLLALVVAASFGGVAFAQQSQNPMSYEAVAKAKSGSWAEYTMSMKGKAGQAAPPTIKMKYALVDKSDKAMGLEIDSATPMGQMAIHMNFEAATADSWKLVKARMQMGQNPPQDMPAAALATGGIKKNDPPGKLVGSETVTTPVGKFETKHYTRVMPPEQGGSTIDVWMSDKAVPTGLVKMTDSRGAEIVLTATGNDAKPKMDMTKPAATATPPGGGPAPESKPAPSKK